MPYPFHGCRQRLRQPQPAGAITLKQLQGHALRGLLSDTRQGAQRVDQLANQRTEAHEDYLVFVGWEPREALATSGNAVGNAARLPTLQIWHPARLCRTSSLATQPKLQVHSEIMRTLSGAFRRRAGQGARKRGQRSLLVVNVDARASEQRCPVR